MRSWKSTLLQLLAPLVFLLLVTGLSYLPEGLEDEPHPPTSPFGTLPRCKVWRCVISHCMVVVHLLYCKMYIHVHVHAYNIYTVHCTLYMYVMYSAFFPSLQEWNGKSCVSLIVFGFVSQTFNFIRIVFTTLSMCVCVYFYTEK